MTEMNRAQIAEQIAYLEALADQAKKAAALHRAALESAAGDELRVQGAAPTWRFDGLGVVSGRVASSAAAVDDPQVFLAWVKAHRPEEVETVERVRASYQTALLKGCRPAPDSMAILTAGGDEIVGVRWEAGGQFLGIGFKVDTEAKEAWGEVAREALSRVALSPTPVEPGAAPSEATVPVPDAVSSFLNAGAVSNPGVEDPWGELSADPWATSKSPF